MVSRNIVFNKIAECPPYPERTSTAICVANSTHHVEKRLDMDSSMPEEEHELILRSLDSE